MKKFCLILSLFIVGCGKTKQIESNNIVLQCVINKCDTKHSISTIEPGCVYTYHTDCGEKITTRNPNIYKIGDTIKFVYIYKRK